MTITFEMFFNTFIKVFPNSCFKFDLVWFGLKVSSLECVSYKC